MKKQDILTNLKSGNKENILASINFIRQDGDNEMLKCCLDVLETFNDSEVSAKILSLLCDLKNQDSAGIIVEHLTRTDKSNVKQLLVSACWQSGLNFSTYIDVFVELLLNSDYVIIIEAFSMIEKIIEDKGVSVEKLTEIRKVIAGSVVSMPKDLQPFIMELISLIDDNIR